MSCGVKGKNNREATPITINTVNIGGGLSVLCKFVNNSKTKTKNRKNNKKYKKNKIKKKYRKKPENNNRR